MATQLGERDISGTLAAARGWIDGCLVGDGSILSKSSLWTLPLIGEAREAFVEHPDAGKDDFIAKLKGQMKNASSEAQRLMAEMLWGRSGPTTACRFRQRMPCTA